MHLTPHEQERLMIRVAADLVERRLTREPALKLNYPEVMALFAAYVLEEARHDSRTVAELMDTRLDDVALELRKRIPALTSIQVMDGVREMISDVQVEATFKDGTKLVTIPDPLGKALPGATVYPGKYELLPNDVEHGVQYNADEHEASLSEGPLWVRNTADRPIQVGSHFHLHDVNRHVDDDNKGLHFSHDQAGHQPADVRGKRLHIAAGTSERIDPDNVREVWVVPIQGAKLVKGLRAGKDSTEWLVP